MTNGTGAYCMGTALGANTRRYHGLLIASTRPPVGRVVALNQVLEKIELRKPDAPEDKTPTQTVEFGTALFASDGQIVRAPSGHTYLETFEKGLSARWTYAWGDLRLRRTLVLHPGEQAVTLVYDVEGLAPEDDATLSVTPLLTLRDFHALRHHGEQPPFAYEIDPVTLQITAQSEQASVTLQASAGAFVSEPDWWYRLHYPRDAYRGQDDTEDHHTPGRFVLPLVPGQTNTFTLTAALGTEAAAPRPQAEPGEAVRAAADKLPGDAPTKRALAIAAGDFVVGRTIAGQALSTIIAGYPWFADWGRDTFIALPGLLLTTGRHLSLIHI